MAFFLFLDFTELNLCITVALLICLHFRGFLYFWKQRLTLCVFAVKVPLDAYMMDFVFSETEDGGIFDNKGGMDYHIPVFGGIVKEPPMHIVHIAVEMAPIAKVTFGHQGSWHF